VEKRTSFAARVVAVLALAGAVVVLIVAISSSLSGSGASTASHHRGQQAAKRHRTTAATYTVKNGDTLTAIAHKTGIPVAQILALNPEVDPQILIAGQTLKLR
jgi:LysM repeat protein